MKNIYKKLRWKLNEWAGIVGRFFFMHTPFYINSINPFICIKEWFKVREWFLFPKIVCKKPELPIISHVSRYYGDIIKNKILYIEILPLQWKSKFADYCFEGVPSITIKIFGWVRTMEFVRPDKGHRNDSYLYYEGMLEKLYGKYSYKKRKMIPVTIYETYRDNIWKTIGQEEETDILPYLTPKAYEEVNSIRRSRNAHLDDGMDKSVS